MDKHSLSRNNLIAFLADIFHRLGSDSYLGEDVSMSEHMCQTAYNAEQAGESRETVVAAFLHDIGHFTGEFPENYIDLGIDNRHETMGAAILENFFRPEVTESVRWHVDAKRYLCAIEPDYPNSLSDASVKTLELQGGAFNRDEVSRFEENPHLDSVLRVRRYDDAGKVAGARTPDVDYYLSMVQEVLDEP